MKLEKFQCCLCTRHCMMYRTGGRYTCDANSRDCTLARYSDMHVSQVTVTQAPSQQPTCMQQLANRLKMIILEINQAGPL